MRRVLLAAIVLAGPAGASAQDWKGYGRVEGRVLDPESKPIEQVKVKLTLPERGGTGPSAVTDKKGRWAVAGIVAGAWEVDYAAEGFAPFKGRFRLPSESARLAPLEVRLASAGGGGGVPPEVAQTLAAAEAAEKAGRLAEARAEYERLIALRPDVAGIAHQRIGASYVQEKQFAPALEHFQKALDADPSNATLRLITAQAAFEAGQADRAATILRDLDSAAIKDADAAYNVGVQLVNAGKPEDAIPFFSQSIAVDPRYVDGYFRRGLAELTLQRTAEARADLQKVLELTPTGAQADLARKAVEQLK
jgi:thioredoxin-like negative regulator of GroEL